MKYVNYRRIAAIATAAGLFTLTGCGSSADNGYGGVGGIGSGLIGGCLPINAQIGFTGNGIYYDSSNIRGGVVPGGQAIGQMTVTTGAAGGPYQRQGSDGTISMNVVPQGMATPYGYNGYNTGYNNGYPSMTPYPTGPTTASVTGFIALSPLVQNDIAMRFPSTTNTGYNYPYTQPGVANPYAQPYAQPYTQPYGYGVPCVSGIAMDVGHTYQTHTIYGGRVYLYMNNTQHGYVLYF